MQLSPANEFRKARGFSSKKKKEGITWINGWQIAEGGLKVERSCLPPPPSALEAMLADSRRMLQLPDGWDDDGAEKIQEETWDRAADFLRVTARRVSEAGRMIFPIPELKPCPDGSIDLHWKNELFELLLNVPPLARGAGDFYGESRDGLTIKGTFKPEIHHQGIVCWLLSNG